MHIYIPHAIHHAYILSVLFISDKKMPFLIDYIITPLNNDNTDLIMLYRIKVDT